ncbi:MAG: SH3 domain-containing protein [Amphiplicatus sp.]
MSTGLISCKYTEISFNCATGLKCQKPFFQSLLIARRRSTNPYFKEMAASHSKLAVRLCKKTGRRKMYLKNRIAGLSAASLLASCSTLSSPQSQHLQYPLIGVEISADWSRGDLAAHRAAFLSSVNAPAGKIIEWVGDSAHGSVTVKEARLVLSPDKPSGNPAPEGLRIGGDMEMDLGVHVIRSNANVRLGPSTEDKVVATLKAGSRVDVIGRLVREPWALVAQNGRIRGYVFDELMARPQGATSRLAGAVLATPVYCRSLVQTVEREGVSSESDDLACKGEGDWFLTEK